VKSNGKAVPVDQARGSRSLVLCLDGSTKVSTTALLRLRPEGAETPSRSDLWEVLARRTVKDSQEHARILLQLSDEMLKATGYSPGDLGALVVGVGPGTFTGVRVAVALARALALALAIPVVGISTLSALAAKVTERLERERDQASRLGGEGGRASGPQGYLLQPERLVVAVDARRKQVFHACYERVNGGRWTRVGEIAVCDGEALGMAVAAPALIAAEDRDLIGELPEGTVFMSATVAAEHLVLGQERLEECGRPVLGPAANTGGELPWGSRLTPWLVAALTGGGFANPEPGAAGTPEAVKPIYVRSPDADVHITKMRDPWAGDDQARRLGRIGGDGASS